MDIHEERAFLREMHAEVHAGDGDEPEGMARPGA